jgi:SAM-dependent methyltransferase
VTPIDGTRRLWDAAAADFDEEPDHGLRDRRVRLAWTELMRRLLPEAPARVADLGCGTGSLSVLLAEHGYVVTGLDFSPKMIAAAETKAAAAGVEVDFRLGDAADPDLPFASFDVVLSRHVLWALAEPDLALGRWLRLLGPQGTLVLVEGRWFTGAGLTASDLRTVIGEQASEITVEHLTNSDLWGKPISDERYAMVVHPP